MCRLCGITLIRRYLSGRYRSLTIGGIIAVSAILIRKELLIPIFCGVLIQKSICNNSGLHILNTQKKKTGVGRRVFLMSPIHHHFKKKEFMKIK